MVPPPGVDGARSWPGGPIVIELGPVVGPLGLVDPPDGEPDGEPEVEADVVGVVQVGVGAMYSPTVRVICWVLGNALPDVGYWERTTPSCEWSLVGCRFVET